MKTHITHLLTFFLLLGCFSLPAQTTGLWGVTSEGGTYGGGTIFKTDFAGNQQVVYSFKPAAGSIPRGNVCQANNGLLYGLTGAGGAYNNGIIFSYNIATGEYLSLFDFQDTLTGVEPWGSLTLAPNGLLYGLTLKGGATNNGTLFSFNTNGNVFTRLHDFDRATTGANATGDLFLAANGLLYGMAQQGGTNNQGTLFSFNTTTNILTKHVDFDCVPKGCYPRSQLMQASNGLLYGVTSSGGTGYGGVLFSFNTATNTYTKLAQFYSGSGGIYWPLSQLTEGNDGKLYGTCHEGGQNYGGIFAYDTGGQYVNTLHTFNLTNGGHPSAGLYKAPNGLLYGATTNGGTYPGSFQHYDGVLFTFNTTTSSYTIINDLDYYYTGANPASGMIRASDGLLYGMTMAGGKGNHWSGGVLYSLDMANNKFTNLVNFSYSPTGAWPMEDLVQTPNGMLYGIANHGGEKNNGVIYAFNPATLQYSVVHTFDSVPDLNPWRFEGSRGSLIVADNGIIYGYRHISSNTKKDVFFSFDPCDNTYTILHEFTTATGTFPQGKLIQSKGGLIYGTNKFGPGNFGNIFSYNISSNTYTLCKSLDTLIGYNLNSGLVEADNGRLYGLSTNGSPGGSGTIFSYDSASNTITPHYSLTNGNSNNYCQLMKASNGLLYGTQISGGAHNNGYVFSFNPANNNFTNHASFLDTVTGSYTASFLTEGLNGLLYGVNPALVTQLPLSTRRGTVFTFNPLNNQILKLVNFNGDNGSSPLSGLLKVTSNSAPGIKQSGDSLVVLLSGAQYQWINCLTNTPVANAASQVFIPTEGGTYSCIVTLNNCPDTLDCVTIVPATAVKPVPADYIRIFPNPATDQVNVQTNFTGNWQLDMLDITGKVVLNAVQVSLKNYTINMQPYTNGVYFIRVYDTAGNQQVSKFVKQ